MISDAQSGTVEFSSNLARSRAAIGKNGSTVWGSFTLNNIPNSEIKPTKIRIECLLEHWQVLKLLSTPTLGVHPIFAFCFVSRIIRKIAPNLPEANTIVASAITSPGALSRRRALRVKGQLDLTFFKKAN
jgi:hypothetical protein